MCVKFSSTSRPARIIRFKQVCRGSILLLADEKFRVFVRRDASPQLFCETHNTTARCNSAWTDPNCLEACNVVLVSMGVEKKLPAEALPPKYVYMYCTTATSTSLQLSRTGTWTVGHDLRLFCTRNNREEARFPTLLYPTEVTSRGCVYHSLGVSQTLKPPEAEIQAERIRMSLRGTLPLSYSLRYVAGVCL